jgi:hypothetical protein
VKVGKEAECPTRPLHCRLSVTPFGQQQATANSAPPVANAATRATDQFFSLQGLVRSSLGSRRSHPLADWFVDSWLADSGE